MARIDYYFSTISPFSYLAGLRLEEVTARHGVRIDYRPMDIAAVFARTGGTAPADRHPSRRSYRLQEIRRQGAKHGLAVVPEPAHFPTNPAPSSYAVIAAQAAGGDVGALVHGLLAACWAGERDIADDGVIRGCLSAAGFDPDLADRGLLSGAEAYAANTEAAIAAGVFGAPFYVTEGGQRFWGQDRLEDLDLHLAGRL